MLRWLCWWRRPKPESQSRWKVYQLRDDDDANMDTEWFSNNRGRKVIVTKEDRGADGTVYYSGAFASEVFEPFHGIKSTRFKLIGEIKHGTHDGT